MKKASFLLVITLSSCASFQVVQTSHTIDNGKDIREIIGTVISAMVEIPSDFSGLGSGGRFVSIQLPGKPLSYDAFSFTQLSGQDFFVPAEIDKAYSFAKWVNALSIIDLGLNQNGSMLSDFYVDQINRQHQMAINSPLPANFPISPMTSALHNDEFYLTTVSYLFPEDSAWTKVHIDKNKLDTFQMGNDVVIQSVPHYTIGTSLQLIKIERPWFKPTFLISSSEQLAERAYIESIIVVRDLKCMNYNGSTSDAKYWKKRGKEMGRTPYRPTDTFEVESATIIGYIYKIL